MLKKYLKNIFPDFLVSIIRERHDLNTYIKYRLNMKRRANEKGLSEKIKIAFIIEYPEVWNSVKSVYYAAKRMDIDVIVICVPKSKTQSNIYVANEENDAYNYLFNDENIQVYNALRNGKWFNLEEYNPDYVFYTRPYNSEYPLPYKTSKVSSYAKVCYIPYAFSQTTGFLFDMTFNWNFMLNTYVTFCPSKIRLDECKKKFAWQVLKKTNYYEYFGFPRFDLLKDLDEKDKKRFTILWLPRWFVNDERGNKKSHFIEYLPYIFNFMNQHQEVQLIIRPHPLMFKTMVEKNIKSKEEVDEIISAINNASNISLDNGSDYIPTFEKTDILLADFTSLLVEYFVTGKPIIYCDDANDFNDDAILLNSTYYHAKEWKDIEKIIFRLRDGNDSKIDVRKKVISEIMPTNTGNIGTDIIEYLIEDYKKEQKSYLESQESIRRKRISVRKK